MKNIKFLLVVLTILCVKTTCLAQAQPVIDSLKTITVKVKGLTCKGDLKTIAGNVEEIKGVKKCEPIKLGAASTFKVIYNPLIAKETEIYKAIEDTEGCENASDRPYKVKK